MKARDIFVAAQPFVIGIGLPLAALVLPITYMQGRDIQKLADGLDTIKSDIASMKGIVESLDKRERLAESDPELIMSKMLGVSAKELMVGPVFYLNNKLVIFPRSSGDEKRLTDGGYTLTSVTPTISGYIAPVSLDNAAPRKVP